MGESLNLSAAFLLGLLGGGHCIGMCGGIMSALSLGSGQGEHGRRSSLHQLGIIFGYNIGRVLTYTLIGLLMGWLGWFIGGFSRETSIALRVFAGIMLIAMGLYLAGWWQGLTLLERAGHKLWKKVQPTASAMLPINSPIKAIAAGAVWGWLPCGLVYSTLIWAAASNSAVQSASLMFAFGMGTLPVLVATGVLAQQMKNLLQSRLFRSAAGIMVMLFGLWTIPGPHQMWVMKTLDFSGKPHQMHGSAHAPMDKQHTGMAAPKTATDPAINQPEMDHGQMNHSNMPPAKTSHADMGH